MLDNNLRKDFVAPSSDKRLEMDMYLANPTFYVCVATYMHFLPTE